MMLMRFSRRMPGDSIVSTVHLGGPSVGTAASS